MTKKQLKTLFFNFNWKCQIQVQANKINNSFLKGYQITNAAEFGIKFKIADHDLTKRSTKKRWKSEACTVLAFIE